MLRLALLRWLFIAFEFFLLCLKGRWLLGLDLILGSRLAAGLSLFLLDFRHP